MLRNYPVNIDIPDCSPLPYCPTISPTSRPARSETLHHHRLLTLRPRVRNMERRQCLVWDRGTGRSGDPGTCMVASFDWVRMRKNRSWDVLIPARSS
ncbi:hypothetical protein AG1IA_10424 [Rhizoctonia solani AG-1 IA]|uniref:Uncharacterized protein n=1 Tax=Thanatephorus cucumeris (strain AG1-IA) TaxID=983506 RepID=L8WBJ3_THACA|nr:hypothetical protein AG1IA_10424 [Rhizoctonia solani AG-1 IA]